MSVTRLLSVTLRASYLSAMNSSRCCHAALQLAVHRSLRSRSRRAWQQPPVLPPRVVERQFAQLSSRIGPLAPPPVAARFHPQPWLHRFQLQLVHRCPLQAASEAAGQSRRAAWFAAPRRPEPRRAARRSRPQVTRGCRSRRPPRLRAWALARIEWDAAGARARADAAGAGGVALCESICSWAVVGELLLSSNEGAARSCMSALNVIATTRVTEAASASGTLQRRIARDLDFIASLPATATRASASTRSSSCGGTASLLKSR